MAGNPKKRAKQLVANGATTSAGEERAGVDSPDARPVEEIPAWEIIDAKADGFCRRVVLDILKTDFPNLGMIDQLTRIETHRARVAARQQAELDLAAARSGHSTGVTVLSFDRLLGWVNGGATDKDPGTGA